MERVDKDAACFKLGQPGQQAVGHDFDIGPHSRERGAEHGAFEHPERVIRHSHDRASGRYARDIRGIHVTGHLKLAQEVVDEHGFRAGVSRFPIGHLQAIDLEEFFQQDILRC